MSKWNFIVGDWALSLLPLQNFQGLPFQEIGVGTRVKELPNQFLSHRARQLQHGKLTLLEDIAKLIDRSKLSCKTNYASWMNSWNNNSTKEPSEIQKGKISCFQASYKPRILQRLGSESILAPKLLHMSFPTCCIPSFKTCLAWAQPINASTKGFQALTCVDSSNKLDILPNLLQSPVQE